MRLLERIREAFSWYVIESVPFLRRRFLGGDDEKD